jgi:hypothetical protein
MHCYALSLVLQSKQNILWAMLGFCRSSRLTAKPTLASRPKFFGLPRGSRRGREDRLLGKKKEARIKARKRFLTFDFKPTGLNSIQEESHNRSELTRKMDCFTAYGKMFRISFKLTKSKTGARGRFSWREQGVFWEDTAVLIGEQRWFTSGCKQ